jgi:multiple RNA-binding domain-containing protein 1
LIQIADELLPKSRRQQKVEKSAPQSDDFFPPPKDSVLKRKREEVQAEHDPKLKEFLEVYQPPSKNNIWSNGESQLAEAIAPAEDVMPEVVDAGDESDNDYQVIAKKPKTSEAPRDVVANNEPALEVDGTAKPPTATVDTGDAMEDIQETAPAEQGPVSDADWLRSRTNRVLDLVEDDEEPKTAVLPSKPVAQTRVAPEVTEERPASAQVVETVDAAPSEEDKIRETGRLYLRNLHFEVAENEIRDHFSKYGSLEEVRLKLSHCHTLRFRMNVKIGTTDA